MSISLHIERLILEGLPVASNSGPQLQAAVEAELTRLLASDMTLSAKSSSRVRVLGNHLQIQSENNATELGTKIGQTLFTTLDSAGFVAGHMPSPARQNRCTQSESRTDPPLTNQQRR
jgi:hypothetical protein